MQYCFEEEMKKITVEECWDCPFADHSSLYEENVFQCPFGPVKKAEKAIFTTDLPAHLKEPPEWCPLRKEDLLVQLGEKYRIHRDHSGPDEVIPTAVSPQSQADLMMLYFRVLYPQGILEPLGPLEFMFYTNQAAKDSWDKDGRTDENADKMFHVICKKDAMTLVHESSSLDVVEIRKNLAANYCF